MPKIAPNFSLSEFTVGLPSNIVVPNSVLQNLKLLAQRLQVIRDFYGKPMTITSGYRTPAHNRAVGGSRNSYHLKGMAADFVIQGISPAQVQKDFRNWSGGLGLGTTFTHVDIRSRKARWTY